MNDGLTCSFAILCLAVVGLTKNNNDNNQQVLNGQLKLPWKES